MSDQLEHGQWDQFENNEEEFEDDLIKLNKVQDDYDILSLDEKKIKEVK